MDADNDDTASTAKLTALDSDEEGTDLSDDDDEAHENRPRKGPATIMYGWDGTSTRALADEEERTLETEGVTALERGEDEEVWEAMPSTEVAKNRRRNECVPSSARLAMPQKPATEAPMDGATVATHGKPPNRLEEGAKAPTLTAVEMPTDGRTAAKQEKPPDRLEEGTHASKLTRMEIPTNGRTTLNHGKPPDKLDEGAHAPTLTATEMPRKDATANKGTGDRH